jgi:hypothetical protein
LKALSSSSSSVTFFLGFLLWIGLVPAARRHQRERFNFPPAPNTYLLDLKAFLQIAVATDIVPVIRLGGYAGEIFMQSKIT